LVTFGEFI